jgi:membrane protein YdbS with pleckstrin-like domain
MDSDDLKNRHDLMDRHDAAVLEPPVEMQQPVAEGDAITTYAPQDLVPAQLLDGGETVLLAIKPSLWFIAFNSVRWILILSLVVVGVLWMSPGWQPVEPRLLIQAAIGFMVLRLAVATLQWVSRLYVLTNRRIMRIRGVFNVDIFEANLTRIQNTYLRLNWYERVFRLGTIDLSTAGTGGIEASWENVARPLEVHEAIRRATSGVKRNGVDSP